MSVEQRIFKTNTQVLNPIYFLLSFFFFSFINILLCHYVSQTAIQSMLASNYDQYLSSQVLGSQACVTQPSFPAQFLISFSYHHCPDRCNIFLQPDSIAFCPTDHTADTLVLLLHGPSSCAGQCYVNLIPGRVIFEEGASMDRSVGKAVVY